MSLPAVSKHLKVLERAGLIARDRQAQRRPSRLTAERDGHREGWTECFDRLAEYLAAQR